MLAARENTVIDNPYQSSLIRQKWNRTVTHVPAPNIPVVSHENTVVQLKDEAFDNSNEQEAQPNTKPLVTGE